MRGLPVVLPLYRRSLIVVLMHGLGHPVYMMKGTAEQLGCALHGITDVKR